MPCNGVKSESVEQFKLDFPASFRIITITTRFPPPHPYPTMPNDVLPASPTMHEIAERAGVGKATVSLALRDDPRLRPETRRRIQKIAEKMGYRTNATVANLMAQLRAGGAPKYQAALGFLNISTDPRTFTGSCAYHEWEEGCRKRAALLGYGLDTFSWHEPGATPTRLVKTLKARNIRGLIIAAVPGHTELPEEFQHICQCFACVVVGVRTTSPPLHFSANNHYCTAMQAVQRLGEYGYRRMGLVLSPEIDAMVDRRFSAGFWAGHEALEGCERIQAFPFHEEAEHPFRAWYARRRPDAIVTIHDRVKQWVEEMHIDVPRELGLAHMDRHDELPGWSGMRHNNGLIGAASVDSLIGQLHRNEFGLPEFAKATLLQSTWVDGPTTMRIPIEASRSRPAPRRSARALEPAGT